MKNLIYSIAGAAIAITSTALVIDYSVRKKKAQDTSAAILLASLAGLAAGAILAYQPEREAKKRLTMDEVLSDEDVERVHENISETLGRSADRGDAKVAARRIEVDEETSIDDFI